MLAFYIRHLIKNIDCPTRIFLIYCPAFGHDSLESSTGVTRASSVENVKQLFPYVHHQDIRVYKGSQKAPVEDINVG